MEEGMQKTGLDERSMFAVATLEGKKEKKKKCFLHKDVITHIIW